MKKLVFTLGFATLLVGQSSGQTYADDVAQIFFDKCTDCHNSNGVAPFTLMNYTDASTWASLIQTEVNNKTMPPWHPNDNYSEFIHNRSLSAAEIATIDSWVNAGAPQGNPANTPVAPTYTNGPKLGPPDLSVRIPDYISKATFGNDDYVCFSIPLDDLTSNQTIKAIEVIPGDPSMVHHALIYIDPSGNYATDTTSHNCGGPSVQSIPLIAAYAPGSSPSQFPNSSLIKLGINITPGSNLIFAMHYPENSQGKLDSTRINLHFYPPATTGVRQVSAGPMLYNYFFNLAANTVDSVDAYYPSATQPLPVDFSIYSVFPHAHLLGQSFIVYAVNHFPPYDKVPMIHIPKWDFEWQDFYVFKHLQKMPAGYKMYGKAVYDNTTNNPYNPNNPPQNMGFGLNTTDEMFLVYFQYFPYQTGDELINIDSLLQLQVPTSTKPLAINEGGLFLTSFPNPSNDMTTLQYFSKEATEVSLGIYDVQGKLVRQLVTGEQKQGEHFTSWNGDNDAGARVAPGVYISRLTVGDKTVTNKIIRSPK